VRKLLPIAATLLVGAGPVDPGAPSLAEERTHRAAREKAVRLDWIRADKRSPRSRARSALGNPPYVRQAYDRRQPAAWDSAASGRTSDCGPFRRIAKPTIAGAAPCANPWL